MQLAGSASYYYCTLVLVDADDSHRWIGAQNCHRVLPHHRVLPVNHRQLRNVLQRLENLVDHYWNVSECLAHS